MKNNGGGERALDSLRIFVLRQKKNNTSNVRPLKPLTLLPSVMNQGAWVRFGEKGRAAARLGWLGSF
jgi:hypothetical protein